MLLNLERIKIKSFLIRVLAQLKNETPTCEAFACWRRTKLMEECKKITTQLGVSNMVHFLGYRNDIASLLQMSDLAVASSYREGLPVNIMEAMACWNSGYRYGQSGDIGS